MCEQRTANSAVSPVLPLATLCLRSSVVRGQGSEGAFSRGPLHMRPAILVSGTTFSLSAPARGVGAAHGHGSLGRGYGEAEMVAMYVQGEGGEERDGRK